MTGQPCLPTPAQALEPYQTTAGCLRCCCTTRPSAFPARDHPTPRRSKPQRPGFFISTIKNHRITRAFVLGFPFRCRRLQPDHRRSAWSALHILGLQATYTCITNGTAAGVLDATQPSAPTTIPKIKMHHTVGAHPGRQQPCKAYTLDAARCGCFISSGADPPPPTRPARETCEASSRRHLQQTLSLATDQCSQDGAKLLFPSCYRC